MDFFSGFLLLVDVSIFIINSNFRQPPLIFQLKNFGGFVFYQMVIKQLTQNKKLQLKDQILTQLFNSGILQQKIMGMCKNYHVNLHSRIEDDVLQTTFEQLAKKDPDDIIQMYCEGGGEIKDKKCPLVGMATRISHWKGFDRAKKTGTDEYYPNHSIGQQIMWTSMLNSRYYLATSDVDPEEEPYAIVLGADEEPEPDIWKVIRSNMAENELQDLEFYLYPPRKRGTKKKELQQLLQKKFEHLKLRIKKIVEDNNLQELL